MDSSQHRHLLISIHASAREATYQCAGFERAGYFNSRLREGGDGSKMIHLLSLAYFNSRLREGGDICEQNVTIVKILISIHASAREATVTLEQIINCIKNFNSRLREGGDCLYHPQGLIHQLFQFTPPRGRRRRGLPNAKYIYTFQFTPPRGRRLFCLLLRGHSNIISIHASAREATRSGYLGSF